MVDGKKHGTWVSRFANGQVMSEGAYDMGVKVGEWTQYWPNGQVKSRATFHNGLYMGHYCCWYENGVKQWEGYYNPIRGVSADGTKDGAWLCYDRETGEVNKVITYKRGSRACPDKEAPFETPPIMGPEPI